MWTVLLERAEHACILFPRTMVHACIICSWTDMTDAVLIHLQAT